MTYMETSGPRCRPEVRTSRFPNWAVPLAVGLSVAAGERSAEAHGGSAPPGRPTLQYRQVPIATPAGYDGIDPLGLDGRGRVFGVAFGSCDDDGVCLSALVRLRAGRSPVVIDDRESPYAYTVNERGHLGGSTFDFQTFQESAAIWRGRRRELVPSLPGLPADASTAVRILTDSGLALVSWYNSAGGGWYLYDGGQVRALPLPPGAIPTDINDRGLVAGILSGAPSGQDRAFRLDTRTGRLEILAPVSPDPNSWGLGINRRGEVLGYSFEFNGIERIGAWDRRGRFDTAWVQGTPQVPTNSNRLTWNDEGLIVVSFTTDGRVYVIPRPGQRLDLASLVQGSTLPTGDPSVIDLNDRGDILLSSPATFETFLLERVGCEGRGEREHRGPREQSDDD